LLLVETPTVGREHLRNGISALKLSKKIITWFFVRAYDIYTFSEETSIMTGEDTTRNGAKKALFEANYA
jgi:hypothetical protein